MNSPEPEQPDPAPPPAPRGRPTFVPSEKDRRVAEAMAAWAMPHERIARVVGCDPKTLRKHFAAELAVGSAKLEAQLAQNLLRIAQGRDRQALIATIFALKSRFGWVEAQPPTREPPLGKKEAARLRALTAGEGTAWGDLLKPSLPPARFRSGHGCDSADAGTTHDASKADNESGWGDLLEPRMAN